MHYRGLTSTKHTHEAFDSSTHTTHEITIEYNNIEFELDLGSIEAGTSLDIEIQIEYSNEEAEPEQLFVDAELYVGFTEDKSNSELKDIILK